MENDDTKLMASCVNSFNLVAVHARAYTVTILPVFRTVRTLYIYLFIFRFGEHLSRVHNIKYDNDKIPHRGSRTVSHFERFHKMHEIDSKSLNE